MTRTRVHAPVVNVAHAVQSRNTCRRENSAQLPRAPAREILEARPGVFALSLCECTPELKRQTRAGAGGRPPTDEARLGDHANHSKPPSELATVASSRESLSSGMKIKARKRRGEADWGTASRLWGRHVF
ncbi:hypothetical protein BESB_044520 [Besnoitia besnoiti]|uniref:Uncharacterized protein n=1 Tax=Besnoitia besnoiti TaxID=94643 RepID=A0A2A9MLC7_BESBE|nr:hypothetical protein BESB_044520 [Besnoitia besnoiti]PFH36260.1 hypothetical protein BESB_044520 [Besnoitia besnoiti]